MTTVVALAFKIYWILWLDKDYIIGYMSIILENNRIIGNEIIQKLVLLND